MLAVVLVYKFSEYSFIIYCHLDVYKRQVYALCVGIVATKIGFIKMSVQTTIVSAIIIASCSANVISTMSYTNFPFLFLWGIMAIISIISYCNIVHKTIRMDI